MNYNPSTGDYEGQTDTGGINKIILSAPLTVTQGETSGNMTFRINEDVLGGSLIVTPSSPNLIFTPNYVTISDGLSESTPFTITTSTNTILGNSC